MTRIALLLSLCTALTLAGCSDDSSNTTKKDAGVTQKDGTADSDGAGLSCPKNFPVAFKGVCLAKTPDIEAKRSQCKENDIVENCDSTGTRKPNLACISGDPPKAPSGPSTVTLSGFLDVFSSGPDADNIVIEVYDAAELLKAIDADAKAKKLKPKTFPSSVTPLGTATVSLNWTDQTKPPTGARACPKDNKLNAPCVVPTVQCGSTTCDLKGDEYCDPTHGCIERLRWEPRYTISNIPTNRYLAIRSRGVNGFNDGTWGMMVEFNVYLRADAPKCKDVDAVKRANDCINDQGSYELEVNALAKSDYSTIPITAGLSGGVPEGAGAIAGEVHDCDDIKLSAFQVGTTPTPTVLAYFNGNPIKTLPDLTQQTKGTNVDGIFSALDVDAGLVTIGAAGLVGGKVVSAGTISAAVLPDTVTVVTFDGRKPAP